MKRLRHLPGILTSILLGIYSYLFMWIPSYAGATTVPQKLVQKISNLWDKYWFYIAIFVALGVLTGLLAFIVLFIRLGANSTNPQERSRILKEMLVVACCTAALGGITLIASLYLSFFA